MCRLAALYPSDLNLRDAVKVSVPCKDNKSVTHTGRGDPNVHHTRPTAALSRFGHDCCEDPGNLGVNGNRLQFAFHAA